MARVKINMPDSYSYSMEVAVRISDINYGGHLGNDSILSIMQEGRLGFLAQFGLDELNIGGSALIQADSAVIYRSEGFHKDVLIVEVACGEFSNTGFDLFYRITNRDTGKEVVLAKTRMVCFNYDERKVVPVPESFLEAVRQPSN